MAEGEEELKSLLMRVKKKESIKAGLKLSIQKIRLWHLVLSFHGQQMGKMWKQCQILSLWGKSQNHCGQ